VAIITRSDLKGIAPPYRSFSEARAGELRKSAGVTRKPQVFLSHSHRDNDVVLNAMGLLAHYGGDPYVDWLDPGMPDRTDAQTAQSIKAKIDSCARFVLLASERALVSRWVPWELGFGDARKGLDRIAILPVRESDSEYSGSEYLQIYSSIRSTNDYDYAVFPPGQSRGPSLQEWIAESR